MNTSKTKDQDKGHSGIQTDLCTREPGPGDRGTATVCTYMQTEIDTRGSGKRIDDTDRESTFTKSTILYTTVGIIFLCSEPRLLDEDTQGHPGAK